LLVIFELAAHGRRNNDSHGVETANYYYLKVHRKYLSTSFSTQSAQISPLVEHNTFRLDVRSDF
jgi:hypothetical protein